MAFPDLLPPADLLQRVGGVEQGLRQRRRLSLIGLVALAVQGTLLVASSQWWNALTSANWAELRRQWPTLLLLLVAVLTLLLVVAMRFWLKESREPFRYTYSVGGFEPVLDDSKDRRLSWLRYDLTERLSLRITRLSLRQDAVTLRAEGEADTAEPASAKKDESTLDSHIHISGYYLIRQMPDDPRWVVEVTPWVRIGSTNSPAMLAIPVKHYLDENTPARSVDGQVPSLLAEDYEQILEWTYFSVATQIYKRIREDVQRKIELLPSNRFRAAAYLYEADDYARSNTLDAYADAAQLYDRALQLYDPSMRPLSPFVVRRIGQRVIRVAAWLRRRIRRWSSYLWPRLGKLEVMQARAQIGYVNMLVNRRSLALMSGRRLTPIFEARPVAVLAVRRLTSLPEEVPGRTAALFDARVALARVWRELGSNSRARRQLRAARMLDPARSEQDAGYVLALGEIEARLRSGLMHCRRAVELDNQSELARFDLAMQAEMIWRQERLEPALSRAIFQEYRLLLRLNPGNIAAWSNVGYMHWLLAQGDDAEKSRQQSEDAFKRGRDYKEIKGETFVGELDYGLARIAAEAGKFNEAYYYFTSAFSAYCAPGTSTDSPSNYYFAYIENAIWQRMKDYVDDVRALHRDPSKLKDQVPASPRVRNAVLAFVVNDFGEACHNLYLRYGDEKLRDQVRSLYQEASVLSPDYAMPHYNLYLLEEQNRYQPSPQGEEEQIGQYMQEALARRPSQDDKEGYIERAIQLQPEWQDANLAVLSKHATIARRKAEAARRLEKERPRRPRAARRRSTEPTKVSGVDFGGHHDEELWAATSITAPDTATDHDYDTAIRYLRTDSRQHQDRATRILADLLPHAWLWRGDGNLERQQFNFGVLKRRRLARELRWEREFEDLHATALYTWGETLLSPNGGRLAGRILGWRSDGRARPPEARRVFSNIERHFTPELFTMLLHLRDHADESTTVQSYSRLIRQTIYRWLAEDPVSFAVLAWVDDGFVQSVGRNRRPVYRRTFGLGQRSQILCSTAATPGLTASLYQWLGDRLLDLKSDVDRLQPIIERLEKGERELLNVPPDQLFEAVGLIERDQVLDDLERCLAHRRGAPLRRLGAALESRRNPTLRRLAAALINRQDVQLGKLAEALIVEFRQVDGGNLATAADGAYQEALAQTTDAQQLYRLGESLARLGNWRSSFTGYRRARKELQRATGHEPPLHPDLVWHGIARALWALERRSLALQAFDQIVEAPGVLGTDWRSRFIDVVCGQQHIGTRELDVLLREWLERDQSGVTGRGEAARRDAGHALLTLARARQYPRESRLMPDEGPSDAIALLPVLTPIGLLADERLFPQGAKTLQARRMLDRGIPELRESIKSQTGVRVPGVRITGSSALTGGEYWVALHEIPLARGAVGGDGDFDRAMLEGLDRTVRRHLDTFLGFHEASEMLHQWQREAWPDTGREELRKRALPDARSMVCFVAVLQRLLREQVPVGDLGPLIDLLAKIDWDWPGPDIEEVAAKVVEQVRLDLRATLPGNRPGTRLIRLSAGVEEDVRRWVREQDGKRFLAIPRGDTNTLASVVQALVEHVPSGADADVALIVRDAELRRFVRRLVAWDLPFLAVLAERELVNPDADIAPATPEGAKPNLDSLLILVGELP